MHTPGITGVRARVAKGHEHVAHDVSPNGFRNKNPPNVKIRTRTGSLLGTEQDSHPAATRGKLWSQNSSGKPRVSVPGRCQVNSAVAEPQSREARSAWRCLRFLGKGSTGRRPEHAGCVEHIEILCGEGRRCIKSSSPGYFVALSQLRHSRAGARKGGQSAGLSDWECRLLGSGNGGKSESVSVADRYGVRYVRGRRSMHIAAEHRQATGGVWSF